MKLAVPTLLTGSLNVTVQCSGPAFVGFGSARLIEVTVGAVRSIVHVYAAGEPVLPALSLASTRNVWLPAARPV